MMTSRSFVVKTYRKIASRQQGFVMLEYFSISRALRPKVEDVGDVGFETRSLVR